MTIRWPGASGKLVLDDLALTEALPLINRYLDKPR